MGEGEREGLLENGMMHVFVRIVGGVQLTIGGTKIPPLFPSNLTSSPNLRLCRIHPVVALSSHPNDTGLLILTTMLSESNSITESSVQSLISRV